MNENSKLIYSKAWKSLKTIVEKNSCSFTIDSETFCKECSKYEDIIISQYMVQNAQLDRHKLAGVIAVCSPNYIALNEKINADEIFLGKYIFSLQIALSLVEEDLNSDLKTAGFLKLGETVKLILPNPSVCKRKCIDADARMLYWQEEKKVDPCIRILSLANTFFLYEELTLLMYDIDMSMWKAYKQNNEVSYNEDLL